MAELQKEGSIIVDDTYRRMSFQQELPSKKQRFQNISNLRFKVSVLCLSTFYFGYCLAYLSTISTETMIRLYGQASQDSTVKGFLIGVLTLGGALGAFISPFLMKCFTRRNFIIVCNIGALVIEGVIQYPNLYCLFVCRAFQGFFMGNFMALVPVYINELSPKQIVETFGVFTQLFVVFGVVFAYGFGVVMTKCGVSEEILWRIEYGFSAITILTVILCCVFKVVPESPNSLIMKGEKQEAKRVINLHTKREYVEQVFKQKILQVNHELNSNNNEQGLKYSKKAYFVGFLLPLMQQSTGINAVVTQIGGIVSKHNSLFGYYTPLIINAVQFIATVGSIYGLKTFGRKPILLTGNFGLGLCDVLIGILFLYIDQYTSIFWLVFALLVIYMAFYGLTIGPVVWMYVPEIIPAKIVPFATTLNWLGSSFCLIVSPIINQSFGASVVFFLFGGLTLFMGVINVFSIVEIKGLNVKQVCQAYS